MSITSVVTVGMCEVTMALTMANDEGKGFFSVVVLSKLEDYQHIPLLSASRLRRTEGFFFTLTIW